jgi:hypothetical protein
MAGAVMMPQTLRDLVGLHLFEVEFPLCGVYFLCHEGEVVYVGQSTNLRCRLGNGNYPGKKYDSVYFLPLPPQELDRVEAAFIRTLRPKYSKQWHGAAEAQRTLHNNDGKDAEIIKRYQATWPRAEFVR